MSFPNMPDCRVPASEMRCEAMTKYQPFVGVAKWAQEPHRCVRPCQQFRDGHSVCHIHARAKDVTYWDRVSPDTFEHRVLRRSK